MKLFKKKAKEQEQEKIMSKLRDMAEEINKLHYRIDDFGMTIDLCSRRVENIDKRVERNREWVVDKFDSISKDVNYRNKDIQCMFDTMGYKIKRLENIIEYSRDGEIVWRLDHDRLYLYIDREEYRVDGLGYEIHINPDDEHEIFFDENLVHLVYKRCDKQHEYIIDYKQGTYLHNYRPVEETCEEVSKESKEVWDADKCEFAYRKEVVTNE